MTDRQLFEAIGFVDDDLILQADAPVRRKPPVHWQAIVSLAACACVCIGGIAVWGHEFMGTGSTAPDLASAAAEAPDNGTADKSADAAPETAVGAAADNSDSAAAYSAQDAGKLAADRRAVCVDGVVYYDTGAISDAETRGTADGTITDTVDSGETPAQNGQSNFGTGYSYQLGPDNTLVVEIDGEFVIFAAEP